MLPAYSIKFLYIQNIVDGLDEAKQVLSALDYLKHLSSEIDAHFDPKFNDPVIVKKNKKLVDQLIDDNKIGARIKRWWTKTDPKFEPSEVLNDLVNSKSTLVMREFHSPQEWASLAIAALASVADDSYPRVCIDVWGGTWKTISLRLYLYRDESDTMEIEGCLWSIDAHENQALQSPMRDCIAKLKTTGHFEER